MVPLWAGALPSSQGHPLLANDGKGTVLCNGLLPGLGAGLLVVEVHQITHLTMYFCTCLLMCNYSWNNCIQVGCDKAPAD